MIDRVRKDHLGRKERSVLEEQIGAAVLDLLFGPAANEAEDLSRMRRPMGYETVYYLDLTEIKWRPQTGEVIFSYQDGSEKLMFSRAKIILSSEMGRILLHCGPLQPSDETCMENPETVQT